MRIPRWALYVKQSYAFLKLMRIESDKLKENVSMHNCITLLYCGLYYIVTENLKVE